MAEKREPPMKHKTRPLGEAIYDYVAGTSLRQPLHVTELVARTNELSNAGMATAPLQCQFLAFLIRAMNARQVVEVGVFTGIGTLWMADAVGPEGRVTACDITDEYPSIGKPLWDEAGVADRIDLRIAPADQTLKQLADDGRAGAYDLAYIDADKEAYDTYYELLLPLMRVGGVLAFDNMLRGGRVADAAADDPATAAIRALNAKLHDDDRVDVSFLPVHDGLYLARKR